LGFTNVHRGLTDRYWGYVVDVLTTSPTYPKVDSTKLPLALKAGRQLNRILKEFNYQDLPHFITDSEPFIPIETEAKVLMAMGKKEEAIQALENIIQASSPPEVRELLKTRIALINSQSQ